jgi:quercetin dioxygenase-like cupin family protein
MHIAVGRGSGPSARREDTFTGEVWVDPVLRRTDVSVLQVFFAPAARTHWHVHEHGQLLQVASGAGLVCNEDGDTYVIAPGDVIWSPAGERHWHGASPSSWMQHLAASHGKVLWADPVTDEEYGRAASSAGRPALGQ